MMKVADGLRNLYRGMEHSISRFPLTLVLLVMSTLLNSIMIESSEVEFQDYIYTLLVGAFLAAVGQLIYERFFKPPRARYILMGVALLLTVGFYFLIRVNSPFDIIVSTKTIVTLFALAIAFIWIPTIENDSVPFYQSFLSAFKAFFITLVFTGVLTLGISAIFYATDYLLFDINDRILSHLLGIVGFLFAPMYFLSMTPLYPGQEIDLQDLDNENARVLLMNRQFSVPRFLEVLLSYIVIPLIVVYTLILLAYVILNFTQEFWTDNLLEPLLVSYAIVVIVVLILSYNLDNKLADFFRKVFPKILLPIVVFQTLASILKIQEMGVTHGRYYVIMFGIFAIIAAILFSFFQPKYHGWLAAILLVLSFISIVPPIDAFTVSKSTQINLLEEKLSENNMLENNEIVPNSNVPEEDKIAITQAATYIEQMGYDPEVTYWPGNLEIYNNFYDVFGFNLTYPEDSATQYAGEYAFLNEDEVFLINIESFDIMLSQSLYHTFGDTTDAIDRESFVVDNATYYIDDEVIDDYQTLFVLDENDNELIRLETEDIFNHIFKEPVDSADNFIPLTVEDATMEVENERVRMRIVVSHIERTPENYMMTFYWLIEMK